MDNLLIYHRILVIDLLLRNEMEVVGQVFDVPNVVLDFLQGDTLHWVGLEHSVDEVLHSWRKMAWYVISTFFDLVEELGHMIVVERQTTADHRIENYAATPDVDFGTAIAHATDDLWRSVVRRAACCLERQAISHYIG